MPLVDLWDEGVVTDALWRLRSDGSALYWVDEEGGVGRMGLDGSGAQALFVGSDAWQGYPDIDLTDTHVYWVHKGDPFGFVRRVPKAGGPVETLVDDYIIDATQPQLEVADGWVYFVSEARIYRFPENDPTDVQPFVSSASTTRLEVDDTHAFSIGSMGLRRYLVADPTLPPTGNLAPLNWYDDPTLVGGTLASVHQDISYVWNCNPQPTHFVGILEGDSWTELANDLTDPRGVAFDGSYVYWSNGCSGETYRVATSGGSPEPLGSATTGGNLPKVVANDTLYVGRGAEIQCRSL